MAVPVVKNKRLKVSPGGLISLPVSARKALGMQKGSGTKVGLSVESGKLVLSAKGAKEARVVRVSPRGNIELVAQEVQVFATRPTRHYWLHLDDERRTVDLIPF